MKRFDVPVLLLSAAGFLAAVIGGKVPVDAQALLPDSSVLAAVLGGEAETPLLTSALITFLSVLAFGIALLTRRVIQIPNQTFAALLTLFFGLLAASVLVSDFKWTSIAALGQWLSYGIVFFAVVACVGRRLGPLLVIGSIFAGCFVAALRGLAEYASMKAIDPTWRIFAGWMNPNAAAALFLVGIALGLGLTVRLERIAAFAVGAMTVLMGLALALTQSKGGLLVLLPTVALFAVVQAVWNRGRPQGQPFTRTVAVTIGIAVLAFGTPLLMASTAPEAGNAAALSRFSGAGETQEQSAGFRSLLWKGSVQLYRANPAGYGLGTYSYHSARPGLTTQTRLAHNHFLQLMVEGSILAPILLLSAGVVWLVLICRSTRCLTPEQNTLRAAVFAAVFALMGHGMIESNLYYFGLGFLCFLLLGIGVLLAADAVAPELMPQGFRISMAAGSATVILILLYVGWTEAAKAKARGALFAGEMQTGLRQIEELLSIAPFDGEAWALAALASRTPEERQERLQKAVRYAPSTKNLRALARTQEELASTSSAYSTLQRALALDPNNFLTLMQVLRLEQAEGNEAEAAKFARRLLAVEETPYFKIRSIPEDVPTETYEARIYLASTTASPNEKISLLQGAVEGFERYAATTVPLVRQTIGADPSNAMAIDRAQQAKEKLALAERTARDLASLYREAKLPGEAAEATSAAEAFSEALAGFER